MSDSTTPPTEKQPKIKHDWYQTEAQVIITVLLKNAPAHSVKVNFGERTLSLSSQIPNSESEYSLELELAHKVDPSMSTYVVTPSKIEVKLKKKDVVRWSALEGEGEEEPIKPIPQGIIDASGNKTAPKGPFRKDWDKIEKDLKLQEAEEKPQGEEALNNMFRRIYGEGSDEVRRAMNKSYVESGGTVLSTNWKEVAKDKVEVKPPDGVEWKQWDK